VASVHAVGDWLAPYRPQTWTCAHCRREIIHLGSGVYRTTGDVREDRVRCDRSPAKRHAPQDQEHAR